MSASSWQAVWLLAVEVAAVVGLTWLIAWRLRSVVWQRTLWQASLIAIVGLLVMEFTSLSRFRFTQQEEGKIPEAVISAEAWPMQPMASVREVAATELSITTEAVPVLELGPVVTEPAGEVVEVKAEMVELKPAASPVALPQAQRESGFPLALAIALGVWVVGSVVLAGRLLVGRFLLLRFCARSRVVADERLYERVQGIARKLGLKKGVQVLETGRIQTPVVFGLVRLTIALPVGFAEKFERRQQEAILAHELAHLAARDPLWYLLADALVSVLWWHPLVWVARARLQVTSELAADEACVLAKHGPETLAECLVTIAQEMHGRGALESIGIEGSGFRSRLGQRVERLLQLSAEEVSRPAAWRTRLVKAGLPVVLVGVLLVGSGWVRRDQSAPWSGIVEGAWQKATGMLQAVEADIRRDPRPVLLAAAPEGANAAASLIGDEEKKREAAVLLEVAKRLYGLGRLEEAEAKAQEAMKLARNPEAAVYGDYARELRLIETKINQHEKYALAGANGKEVQVFRVIPIYEDALVKGLEKLTGKKPELLNIDGQGPNNRTVGAWKQIVDATKDVISKRGVDVAKLDISPEIMNYEPKLILLNVRGFPKDLDATKKIVEEIHAAAEAKPPKTTDTGVKALEPLVSQVFTLKHAVPTDIVPAVHTAITDSRSKILADDRAKKLLVNAVKGDMGNVEDVIAKLDVSGGRIEGAILAANSVGHGTQVSAPSNAVYEYDKDGRRVSMDPETNMVQKTGTNLYIRIGKVDTNSFFNEVEKKTGEKIDLKVEGNAGHYSYSSVNLNRLLQKYFVVAGLDCEVNGPDAGGTRVSFNPASGYLWVRGTTEEVEIARKLVQPFLIATLPVPIPNARTNAVLTGRQRNLVKLDQIVLKEVFFDDKPLSEVVMFLSVEARRLDPEKKGVNFIINSNLDDQPGRSQVDSRGLTLTPVTNPNRGGVDLEKMRIKINPPLKNLRLVDALDAITKVATPPVDGVGLSFMVEDHGVVFRQRVVDLSQLFTRVYKLDTNKLMTLLEKETEGKVTPLSTNVTASGQTNVVWTVPTDKSVGQGDKLSVMVRQYLGGQGVNLAAAEAGGVNTQIFFNDRTGVLMVRCTRQDLEIIETALENLGAIEKVMRSPKPLGDSAPAGTNAVSKLVQEAKQLYELRRMEEAEVKLREAMKLDPVNSAAYYYMNLIQEARYSDMARKRDFEQRTRLNEIEPKGWMVLTNRSGLPTPNPYVRTNVARTLTKAQQRIETKLDGIVMKEVFFDGLPLAEVVRFLREESIKQDPEKVGINFIINSKLDDQPGGEGGKTLRDPLGAPLAPVVSPGPQELNTVLVTINPPLKNLTMREMLSAITNATAHVGKHGLDYRVEDFGVTFRQRVIDPPQLFTRIFKVEPKNFNEGLQKVWVSSGMPANTTTNLQDLWREFVRHAGVKTDTNSMATNQIFYNDKTGVLMVRAALQDLEVIQSAIEVLNMGQAQVQVEVRYIEVSDEVAKKMGLNWFTSGPLSSTNSLKAAQLMNPTIPTGANVKLEAPVLPNYVSVLSPMQRDDLIKKLLSGEGVDMLTAPRVTTVSGRQAQVAVPYQTNITVGVKEQGKSGNTKEVSGEQFVTNVMTGPSLDIIPRVMADGYALQMTWVVCMTEFVGYDQPPKGMEKDTVLPRFRVRQVANTSALRDGQTLLIGCGTSEVRKEQKPGLFRGGPKTETRHVIVMLTPRIIDPAGNFVNSDKELGY